MGAYQRDIRDSGIEAANFAPPSWVPTHSGSATRFADADGFVATVGVWAASRQRLTQKRNSFTPTKILCSHGFGG